MRLRWTGLCIALMLSLTGQRPACAAPAAAPFLWRVQGPSATHYLLGSIHLCRSYRAWMPQLRRFLNGDQPQMIVVGAAHLVGPDGLVNKLRARGYRVTPGLTPPSDQLSASASTVLHAAKLRR